VLKRKGIDCELVFISHDKDIEQFEFYFRHMAELGGSWLAAPFDDGQAEREMLARSCSVMGIPTLTVISPDGFIIAPNARGAVSADPNGDNFPWKGATGSGAGGPFLVILLVVLMFFILPKLIGVLFT
jgi:nucleoredoxin